MCDIVSVHLSNIGVDTSCMYAHYDTLELAPSSEEIWADFELASALATNLARARLGSEAIECMAMFNEGQPKDQPSPTDMHAEGTAALMIMHVAQEVDDRQLTVAALTGRGHDVGKLFRHGIMALVQNGQRLTDTDFDIVREHAGIGANAIDGRLAETNYDLYDRLQIVRAIRAHHSRPEETGVADDELTLLLKTADAAHAMLVDPNRLYRAKRMRKEGLLNRDGSPDLSAITTCLLRDKPERVYGVPLRRLIGHAVLLMPSNEPIDSNERSRG
jgi:hypothetical protein